MSLSQFLMTLSCWHFDCNEQCHDQGKLFRQKQVTDITVYNLYCGLLSLVINFFCVFSRAKMFACKSEDETTVVSSETTTTTTSMRKKSYINISCSVSGYNGLNSYDSKARDSSRERLVPLVTKSRDSSPSPTTMTSTAVWTPVAGNRKSTGFLL